jgi:hypothetical protein
LLVMMNIKAGVVNTKHAGAQQPLEYTFSNT